MTELPKTSAPAGPPPSPIPDLVAETHLISAGTGVALCGARCPGCGGLAFPFTPVCYRCGTEPGVRVALATSGVLYTYTTVHVSSSRPTPYSIGYVDLDDGVRVLAELRGDVAIGNRVRLETDQAAWYFTAGDAAP